MPVIKNLLAPGDLLAKKSSSFPIISNPGILIDAFEYTIIITVSGGSVTLPVARDGQIIYIRNDLGLSGNTILPNGTDTIDGNAFYTLAAIGQGILLQYSAGNTNWYSLAQVSTTITGSFTATVTGTTGPVTRTFTYVKYASGFVSMDCPQSTGAADGTLACTITGMPAIIRPSAARQMQLTVMNGSIQFPGIGQITTAGIINLFFFTALGTNPGSVFSATGNNGMLRSSFNYLM